MNRAPRWLDRAGGCRDRSPSRNGLALALIALVTLVGCGGGEQPSASAESNPASPASPASDDDEPLEQKIDRLRSLGYVGSSTQPPDAATGDGLVRIDEQRWSPGFTLYNSRNYPVAELLDQDGSVLHGWQQADGRTWDDCELLPDGDLLVVGSDLVTTRDSPVVDRERYVMRMDWDGRVLWKRMLFTHHDVHWTDDGRIFVLTHRYAAIPGLGRNLDSRIDYVTMLSAEGQVLEERSIYDALLSNPAELEFRLVGALTPGREHWDPFHTNSVQWLHDERLADRDPIYATGNVLVSVRHQDMIAIIDWATNKLLWAWGPGEIQGPHDAQVLENGNILLFDNGLWRDWSRVIELDPLTKRIVWEYRAANPTDFYSRSGGGCQRLPNGNTLITNSDEGHAFEVTRQGDVVWEFFNPKKTQTGKRLSCSPMKRYAPEMVESILARRR